MIPVQLTVFCPDAGQHTLHTVQVTEGGLQLQGKVGVVSDIDAQLCAAILQVG